MPTILIVEDEPSIRFLIRYVLERQGHTILEAENGPEAFGILDSDSSIDLIITDLRMPGLDPIELIQGMNSRRPNTPIIIQTAHRPLAQEAQNRYDVRKIIIKPFERSDILKIIDEVLNPPV